MESIEGKINAWHGCQGTNASVAKAIKGLEIRSQEITGESEWVIRILWNITGMYQRSTTLADCESLNNLESDRKYSREQYSKRKHDPIFRAQIKYVT